MSERSDSAHISPTAHYTGHVWYHYGMGEPALRTAEGAVLHALMRPANLFQSLFLGGPTLDGVLLDRHALIDHTLETLIRSGRVGQVLEIAAGMSPRGVRFVKRHHGLRYLEADLAGMVQRKRAALAPLALDPARHRVDVIDALSDDGPHSLGSLAAQHLRPDVGTAIISEGLVNYFNPDAVEAMWARFARTLARYPAGVYLSDIHLRDETLSVYGARWFRGALQRFSRGGVHFHYADAARCTRALMQAGFGEVALLRPAEVGLPRPAGAPPRQGQDLVRVVVAEV